VLARAKFEYQPTRALFFRLVGEYRDERVAALQMPSRACRSSMPRASRSQRRARGIAGRLARLVRASPAPSHTSGSGALFDPPVESQWSSLERANDGFFVKIAYLFRR